MIEGIICIGLAHLNAMAVNRPKVVTENFRAKSCDIFFGANEVLLGMTLVLLRPIALPIRYCFSC